MPQSPTSYNVGNCSIVKQHTLLKNPQERKYFVTHIRCIYCAWRRKSSEDIDTMSVSLSKVFSKSTNNEVEVVCALVKFMEIYKYVVKDRYANLSKKGR
jgi:predicted nucleic-acid-binding Zn-ribbon protein